MSCWISAWRCRARPVLQRPDGEAGIGLAPHADDGEAQLDLLDAVRQLVELVDVELGVLAGRVARRVDDGEQRALVLLGRQLARGVEEQKARRGHQRGDHHKRDRAVVQRRGDAPLVPVLDRVELRSTTRWKRPGSPPFSSSADIIGDTVSATNARDHHRAGKREGELAEQRAGEPFGEAERREHRDQRQRHGDDRAGDLAHAGDRRLERRQPLLDVAVDVLHHHDGVVDHQADGQHHGEQRQVLIE
jgi:hypothetical protein